MTGWNASLVTRDGEEIEPSTKLAGSHDTASTQPSVSSNVHATTLHETGSAHETFQCPECGNEFAHREGEANCLRSHARGRADLLQQRADGGDEDLLIAEPASDDDE